MKRIKGKVVFNDYRYSVSTARHQRKVRTLLRELGIKIDIEVSFRASLSGYETLRALNAERKEQDRIHAINTEMKRRQRNDRARARRALRKAEEKMQNDLMTKQLNVMRGEP